MSRANPIEADFWRCGEPFPGQVGIRADNTEADYWSRGEAPTELVACQPITYPKSAADTATATQSAAVVASRTVTDTATGASQSVSLKLFKTATDTATSTSQISSVRASRTTTDTAAALSTLVVTYPKAAADTASATQSAAVTASNTGLSDNAHGADVGVGGPVSTDTAVGHETSWHLDDPLAPDAGTEFYRRGEPPAVIVGPVTLGEADYTGRGGETLPWQVAPWIPEFTTKIRTTDTAASADGGTIFDFPIERRDSADAAVTTEHGSFSTELIQLDAAAGSDTATSAATQVDTEVATSIDEATVGPQARDTGSTADTGFLTSDHLAADTATAASTLSLSVAVTVAEAVHAATLTTTIATRSVTQSATATDVGSATRVQSGADTATAADTARLAPHAADTGHAAEQASGTAALSVTQPAHTVEASALVSWFPKTSTDTAHGLDALTVAVEHEQSEAARLTTEAATLAMAVAEMGHLSAESASVRVPHALTDAAHVTESTALATGWGTLPLSVTDTSTAAEVLTSTAAHLTTEAATTTENLIPLAASTQADAATGTDGAALRAQLNPTEDVSTTESLTGLHVHLNPTEDATIAEALDLRAELRDSDPGATIEAILDSRVWLWVSQHATSTDTGDQALVPQPFVVRFRDDTDPVYRPILNGVAQLTPIPYVFDGTSWVPLSLFPPGRTDETGHDDGGARYPADPRRTALHRRPGR